MNLRPILTPIRLPSDSELIPCFPTSPPNLEGQKPFKPGSVYSRNEEIAEAAYRTSAYVNRIYFDTNETGFWICTCCFTDFRGPGEQFHRQLPTRPCPIKNRIKYRNNPELVYVFGPKEVGDDCKTDGRSLFKNKAEVKKAIEEIAEVERIAKAWT